MIEGLTSTVAALQTLFRAREYQEVVDRLREVDPSILMADPELVLILAASLQYLFLPVEAAEILRRAEIPIRVSNNRSHLRRWQNLMGNALIEQGRLDEAREVLSECLASAEEANHMRVIGYASNGLGVVASLRGEVEEAVRLYTRAIAVWQQLGDGWGVGSAHYNLGLTFREWGRLNDAVAHFALAEEYYSTNGTPAERVYPTAERAMLYMDLGDEEMAERLAMAAVERSEELPNPLIRAAAAKVLGAIRLRRRGPAAARQWLEAAAVAAEHSANPLIKAEVEEELAILELHSGRRQRAEVHRARSCELYGSIGANRHVQRFEERYASVSIS